MNAVQPALESLTILIAEDSAADRMLLSSIVRRQGHQVLTAANGAEAVEVFRLQCPQLVLMDAMMPVMDGFEAARQIKALAGETLVPIIFLTSLSESEALARCLEVGGDDVQEGEDGAWEIYTNPNDLALVTKAVEAKGLTLSDSTFVRIPKNVVNVSDEDAPKVLKLMDILDDQDDVQNLFANFEVSDAALEAE